MSARGGTQHDELRELQQRLTLFKISLLLVVGVLVLRLWYLQISEGSYYHDLSENNRTRSVVLEPARGLIYDRLAQLLPPPPEVTREGIMALDPRMLDAWKKIVSQLWQ